MNYTNTQSLAYRIAKLLYIEGPMPSEGIIALLPADSERSVRSTIGRMCFEADLENSKGMMQIRAHLRRHFAEKFGDKSKVAEPRASIPFRPLQSLPWAQHKDRLREISFIGLGGVA